MAISNKTYVYIDGINRTNKAVTPPKRGNFLDERLDEATLSLRAIKLETISPRTPVEIVRRNELHYSGETVDVQTDTTQFLCANDASEEMILGSGLYNHDLYLIELTKALELYIVDTLTYTNDIGRIFTNGAVEVQPQDETFNNVFA